ncbi:MAG: SHOCT domain-containing protein [Usitatibacteraceae bacterium]
MLKILCGAMFTTLLIGCSSNEIMRGPVNVSVGQQLIDLKKAHDSGALTKREYDEQREKLIDSVR